MTEEFRQYLISLLGISPQASDYEIGFLIGLLVILGITIICCLSYVVVWLFGGRQDGRTTSKRSRNPPHLEVRKMPYNLFLDDERYPSLSDRRAWVILRSYEDAVGHVAFNGCPKHISFDHDLGSGPSGKDFANFLIETDLNEGGTFIPRNFSYVVHSENPVGAKAIRDILDRYLEVR